MEKKNIGEFIANERKKQTSPTGKPMTQLMLANKARLHRTTVADLEAGKAFPDIHTAMILSKILQCTVDELLMGEREKKGEADVNGR